MPTSHASRGPGGVVHGLRLGPGLARRLEAAPRTFGRVHSVFTRAVNVLAWDGRLVTLQGPWPLAAPFAVALDRLLLDEVEPGREIEHVRHQLRMGGLVLDWGGAQTADLTISAAPDPGPLHAALLEGPVPPGAPALGSPRGREALSRLGHGIATEDPHELTEGALALVGLGEGLTPAGDDCLVGALAVLRRLRPRLLARHPEISQAISTAARDGTTMVGREFLLHALEGAFSEVLAALARAASAAAARRAATELLSTGATSGADTLAGMRIALAACGEG